MTEDGRKNHLFIIHDSPYGNERPCNAPRLAINLAKHPEACVQVFLVGGRRQPRGRKPEDAQRIL